MHPSQPQGRSEVSNVALEHLLLVCIGNEFLRAMVKREHFACP